MTVSLSTEDQVSTLWAVGGVCCDLGGSEVERPLFAGLLGLLGLMPAGFLVLNEQWV